MWGDVQHIYVASAYVLRNDYAKSKLTRRKNMGSDEKHGYLIQLYYDETYCAGVYFLTVDCA